MSYYRSDTPPPEYYEAPDPPYQHEEDDPSHDVDTCKDESCSICYDESFEFDDRDDWEQGDIRFADPTGHSALRAASPSNPRDQPCPTCLEPNVLTREDVALHYQCDACADRAERGLD